MRSRGQSRHGPLLACVAGGLALVWLLLRSGSRPSRLSYPCQQAAISAAVLAFGAPFLAAVVAIRRRMAGRASWSGMALAAVGLAITGGIWSYLSQADAYSGPLLQAGPDYRARVFHSTGGTVPQGDSFPNLDDLIEIMGADGLKFYESATPSLTAGPAGIVAANDVVLVKINYQWPERGGTNVDLLRGLIRRIVDHPDGFSGEVVVVENAQFNSVQNFDRDANNAEETTLSPHDVVVYFQSLGYRVSHSDWTVLRYTTVSEYSQGNPADGYYVYPYDSTLHGRISYPKFQTAYGTRVSVKHGIWDAVEGYDRERLKLINVPVLKSHHAVYGATACVKHYMGLVTRELSTNSHSAIHYGLLGALLGEIGLADLNLLDATWINANPYDGPWTTYAGSTRWNTLVAGVDPVAVDIWAVKNVLIPGFLANGYSPPWPAPSADPDEPTSPFRQYLDASANYILDAGYETTQDLTKIDATDLAPPGEVSAPDGPGRLFDVARVPGGYELSWSDPIRGAHPDEFVLYRFDLDTMGPPACEAHLGSGTDAFLPQLSGNSAFIVAGRNAAGDGSFGRRSPGGERPSPAAPDVCP